MNVVERQGPNGPLRSIQAITTVQCGEAGCAASQAPVDTLATANPAPSTAGNQNPQVVSSGVIPDATTIVTSNTEASQGVTVVPSFTGSNQAANTGTEAATASSSSKGGLASGAVAGVAIGCLLAGALLAFAAAFFFFKRRNNKSRTNAVGYNNYTDSTPELVMMQKTAGRNSPYVQVSQTPIPAPAPIPNPAPAIQQSVDVLAAILPKPARESEVQSRVANFFKQIHRHIDTYYRDVHASITASMEPDMMAFGARDVNMADLLQDCSSPTTALKYALMAYVLRITGPKSAGGDERDTLWPSELGGVSGGAMRSDPNLNLASTYHRRLSVLLHTHPSSPSNTSRHIASSIREAAEHFSLTFFPWAHPGSDDAEKDDDLARIISEALETRIWLCGQPDEYVFRWDGIGSRGVVVSPELVTTHGDGGRSRVVLESGVAGI
ncbi:hypothetical protein EK21DRAFT_52565 [Setomelanomma holmii]|uniref:Uncharacterized protein n=1 Tax=Setomelanomma holmii TaxID=210430 RepID=A0A9P4HJ44_9PLEO|nr:hypothetical protein EK21DRAFT_52565 [Setomelanomma holmii]